MRDFRLFAAVHEERSFSLAAVREGATQSGVSQHVRKLEDRHGVRLFIRDARGVTPTPAGDRFYAHCIQMLRAHDEAVLALQADAGAIEGDVRVGLMPTLTAATLAPALFEMRARHRNVRIDIVEGFSGALTDDVEAGRLDFAVVPALPAQPRLRIRPFATTPEVLLARASDGLPDLVRLNEVRPLRLIVPQTRNTRADAIRTLLAAEGVEVVEWLELDSMIATFDLVAQSDWMAIVPKLLTMSHARSPLLSISAIDPEPRLDLVSITLARRALPPAAEAFHAVLRDQCTAMIGA